MKNKKEGKKDVYAAREDSAARKDSAGAADKLSAADKAGVLTDRTENPAGMAADNPADMRESKLNPLYGGGAFTVDVIIFLLISLVASGIIAAANLSGTDGAAYINVLVSPVAIAITAAIFFRLTRVPVRRVLPIKTKPKYYIIGLLLIFGLLFSLNSLNDLLVKLFESWGYRRKPSALPDFTGWNVLPALIAIAIIPAVAEETLFRGILLSGAERETGSPLAIVFSGLCFSLYHGSVEQTLYQFICGCLFAFLTVRSRSIAPSVLIHFLNNAIIIVLCACGCTDMSTGELIMPAAAEIALTVISAVCLAAAVLWLILDNTPLEKRKQGGVAKFFIGAGIGLVAMVALWIANLL